MGAAMSFVIVPVMVPMVMSVVVTVAVMSPDTRSTTCSGHQDEEKAAAQRPKEPRGAAHGNNVVTRSIRHMDLPCSLHW